MIISRRNEPTKVTRERKGYLVEAISKSESFAGSVCIGRRLKKVNTIHSV